MRQIVYAYEDIHLLVWVTCDLFPCLVLKRRLVKRLFFSFGFLVAAGRAGVTGSTYLHTVCSRADFMCATTLRPPSRGLYGRAHVIGVCLYTWQPHDAGEVLPHSNGEVMLAVVGVGHVWSGFSPLCTHAFITSAALRQNLNHHYPVSR
jgi:hypothetical protein